MTLGLGNDGIWERFWAAVGHPEHAKGDAVGSNAARRANRAEIVERIQQVLRTRPRAEWLALLARAKVPAGPIYRVDEVVDDPHFRERGLFFRIPRDGHNLAQVGLGIHVDGAAAGYAAPPPRFGEHGAEVSRNCLGYDEATIAALKQKRII